MPRKPIVQFWIADKQDQEHMGPEEQWEIEQQFSDREASLDMIFVSLKDLSDARAIGVIKKLLKKLEKIDKLYA